MTIKQPIVSSEPNSQSTLYTIFRYLAIGSGIVGIGFLIAIIGYYFSQK